MAIKSNLVPSTDELIKRAIEGMPRKTGKSRLNKIDKKEDFSDKMKEMGESLTDSSKLVETYSKNIIKLDDIFIKSTNDVKSLIDNIIKLEKMFNNINKSSIHIYENFKLLDDKLYEAIIKLTNFNKETKLFINNIDKMGTSIEKTGLVTKDSIDMISSLSKSLEQLTIKMNTQRNSIEQIAASIEKFGNTMSSNNKTTSDNIFKLNNNVSSYHKNIKNEVNNLFDNHVINYFTDKLNETGNVWRNRIKDLFYGITNRINSLYEDVRKNLPMNNNFNNKKPSLTLNSGLNVNNLTSDDNNVIPDEFSNSNIGSYLENIQSIMIQNYDKILEKLEQDEDMNEKLNKSKPLNEQLVMKKTPEGVAANWLYKQMLAKGMTGGGIGGGLLSSLLAGPRGLLTGFWESLTAPLTAGVMLFQDKIRAAVDSIFRFPKKVFNTATNILKSNLVRFGGGLIGVGIAVNDAYEGFKLASEWFKKPQNKLDMSEKVSATIGGVIGGVEGGLEGALKNGAKWALIGNMFAPGIGAIIGGMIGTVTGYIGGEAIANFLKNMWDGAKKAFSGFADWISDVWNGKKNKEINERIENVNAEQLKDDLDEVNRALGKTPDVNDDRKFVDLQERELEKNRLRDEQIQLAEKERLRQEKLQDARDIQRNANATWNELENRRKRQGTVYLTPEEVKEKAADEIKKDGGISTEDFENIEDILENGFSNNENFNKMAEMGIHPGSIYTHDIHLEELFVEFLKQNETMIIKQDDLNKLMKDYQMMNNMEVIIEQRGTVSTPDGDKRPLDQTQREREVANMTNKEQIYADTSLPETYMKKLDDNLKIHGNANIEGLTPEMKARLALAAEEYKRRSGKDLDITSGYRSGTKQADIMMDVWRAGKNRHWYRTKMKELGIIDNRDNLLVSDVIAKQKLAEYYDVNKIGHASGTKIDVGRENLALKAAILKQYGIVSTNIPGDPIDFILDKNFNNILSPSSARKEQEDSMKTSANQSVSGNKALADMVKRHEGKHNEAYIDTTGNWTIGYGHKLKGNNKGLTWDDNKINQAFNSDLQNAWNNASSLPEFGNMNLARQNALTDMAFNLGKKGLMNFVKMRAALANGDFETAAKEVLDSKYASQTGNRAKEIAEIIRTGKMNGVVEGIDDTKKALQIAEAEKKILEDTQKDSAKHTASAIKAQEVKKEERAMDKSQDLPIGQTTLPQNIDPIPARILAYNFEIEGFSGIFKG